MIDKPIPPHAPPVLYWLGAVLKNAEQGHTEMHIMVRSDMANPLGLLHGGVQAMILDEIMGMTVAALDKETASVSINLSVDFIGKAKVGDTIVAKAQVVRNGRQIVQMEGFLSDINGNLIAKGTCNLLNLLSQ